MDNTEQHEMLCAVLTKLVDVLDCDELSLLAYHCGIAINDFYQSGIPAPIKSGFIHQGENHGIYRI